MQKQQHKMQLAIDVAVRTGILSVLNKQQDSISKACVTADDQSRFTSGLAKNAAAHSTWRTESKTETEAATETSSA